MPPIRLLLKGCWSHGPLFELALLLAASQGFLAACWATTLSRSPAISEGLLACWLHDGPLLELALLPASFYYGFPGMAPLFSLLPVSHPRLLSWGPKLKILSCCFLALRARGPYLLAAGFLGLLHGSYSLASQGLLAAWPLIRANSAAGCFSRAAGCMLGPSSVSVSRRWLHLKGCWSHGPLLELALLLAASSQGLLAACWTPALSRSPAAAGVI